MLLHLPPDRPERAGPSLLSSAVEQLIRNEQVVSSNLTGGSLRNGPGHCLGLFVSALDRCRSAYLVTDRGVGFEPGQ